MTLQVNGQIESGKIADEDGICLKFDFTYGKDWKLTSGNETGISQHSYKSMQTNDKVVWNYPFELTFGTSDISGWPKLCLQLTSRDIIGRDCVCGYGVMHVPTQPGHHTRYIQLFKPKSSNSIIELLGLWRGKPVEYRSPVDLLHKTTGREVTRVENAGVVKVTFSIGA